MKTIWKALFYETKKNGRLQFSTKKFWAVYFCSLAVVDKFWLVFITNSHWVTKLSGKVSPEVISSLIYSLDGLAFGALAVYGWAKSKGGA